MIFYGEVDGVEEMVRGFNRIEQGISDLRPIWPEVAKVFWRIEGEQFGSEGAKGASGIWAALSKAYSIYKAVKFPSKLILQATGSLFNSLTDPEAPGAVYQPAETSLTIGTSVDYAVYHQRGTPRMPSRKPISLSEANKRDLTKAIQKGLVQFVRRQGFQVLENAA